MKLFAFCCIAALLAAQTLRAATFIVTVTNDSGAGSLRQAILNANTTVGMDTIKFSIGSGTKTILPLTSLPTVSDAVVIDATTQPGFSGTPIIEVSGSAMPTSSDGLLITSSNTTVRGLVLNNFGNALTLAGGSSNLIAGNFIGTDVAGATAKANSRSGILVTNSSGNVIGGTTSNDRNVISGNSGNGIEIHGTNASNNVVRGNFIGLAANGSNPLGNSLSGILVDKSPNAQIGGVNPGEGNVVSANSGHGINIFGAEATFASIQQNFVGTDASGTLARGNTGQGIRIESGFATVGEGNVVSANASDGILLIGTNAENCVVAGNYVGTRADGTAGFMGNSGGVAITAGAHNNLVSLFGIYSGNLIAFNNGDGVLIGGASTVSNSIFGNMIFSNANLGINLEPTAIYTGTVTTNDPGDADIGGNNLQNFPVLNPVVYSNGDTIVSGMMTNCAPSQFFYIDLYRSYGADLTGYGEGENYLGFISVFTDGAGFANFSTNISDSFPNEYFTATATDGSTGDTSEFSQAVQATAGRFAFSTNSMTLNESAGTVFIPVYRVGGSYGPASVQALPFNGSASNGLDFNFAGVTMNFTNGQTNGGFNIAVIDDTVDEPEEYFSLYLTSPTSAAIGSPGLMTLTLIDNDPPALSVPDVHFVEGNSGNRDVVLNFNLSSTSAVPVSVNFVTADGTATSADHQNYAAPVSFSIGQTNRVITLVGAIIGDALSEPNETFFVNLSNPTNATLVRTQAVVTIIDDDPLPSLKILKLTNNAVGLIWPTNAWRFLLESNANLATNIWNTVSNTPIVTGTNFAVTNLMSSNAFYRLHFPF